MNKRLLKCKPFSTTIITTQTSKGSCDDALCTEHDIDTYKACPSSEAGLFSLPKNKKYKQS